MSQILVDIAGVDHQQILLLLKAVEVHVIDNAAGLIGHQGVLGLVEIQSQHIAGKDVLQKLDAIRALNV